MATQPPCPQIWNDTNEDVDFLEWNPQWETHYCTSCYSWLSSGVDPAEENHLNSHKHRKNCRTAEWRRGRGNIVANPNARILGGYGGRCANEDHRQAPSNQAQVAATTGAAVQQVQPVAPDAVAVVPESEPVAPDAAAVVPPGLSMDGPIMDEQAEQIATLQHQVAWLVEQVETLQARLEEAWYAA